MKKTVLSKVALLLVNVTLVAAWALPVEDGQLKEKPENGIVKAVQLPSKGGEITYVPSDVKDLLPPPYALVKCPFAGENLKVEFHMNATGPYGEGKCYWCTDPFIAGRGQAPGTCGYALDARCFHTNVEDDSVVTVLPGCYGCLQCTASNTINGIVSSRTYQYMLARPQDTNGNAAEPTITPQSTDYPPRHIPALTHITAGQTVRCPFQGKPALNVSFSMNSESNYSCSGTCRNCNSTCAQDKRHRDPKMLAAKCKAFTPCFYYSADDRSSVVIMPDCYGCLQCTASNTINGKTHTASYTWMVDTTRPVTCPNKISDLDVTVSPGSRSFVPGHGRLNITARFRAVGQMAYLVQHNGKAFEPKDHGATASLSGPKQCQRTLTLDFQSPKAEDAGSYLIYLGNAFSRTSFTVNITASSGASSPPAVHAAAPIL